MGVFHYIVEDESPFTFHDIGGESPVGQWLYELLELCSCLVSSHPLLHYHHSLLLAMAARLDDSRRTFLRFCDK